MLRTTPLVQTLSRIHQMPGVVSCRVAAELDCIFYAATRTRRRTMGAPEAFTATTEVGHFINGAQVTRFGTCPDFAGR